MSACIGITRGSRLVMFSRVSCSQQAVTRQVDAKIASPPVLSLSCRRGVQRGDADAAVESLGSFGVEQRKGSNAVLLMLAKTERKRRHH